VETSNKLKLNYENIVKALQGNTIVGPIYICEGSLYFPIVKQTISCLPRGNSNDPTRNPTNVSCGFHSHFELMRTQPTLDHCMKLGQETNFKQFRWVSC
jgi:hypothetical protein